MATRGRPATKRTTASKTKTPAKPERDVTQYADKVPTEYHKCFARWIVEEVGYRPSSRKDLLMGVAIATAARPTFTASEYLANWREETGEAKRGPKTAADKTNTKSKGRSSKPVPEPEPEEDEDDWTQEDVDERQEKLEALTMVKLKALAKDDDHEATAADLKGLTKKSDVIDLILDIEFPEDDEDEEEEESDEDDEDSEEDDEEDDDYEDDEEEEDEEDEEDDEEEEDEPEPPKRGRGRSSSAKSSARTTRRPAAKGKSGASAKSGSKGDYLF